ncbi:MAG: ribonuclease D [Clostridia bacterium]|nr:ribonuclease D [Clostridia bacterium]
MNEYATRIHLKTSAKKRNDLIDFCLNGKEQFLAIGWTNIYEKEATNHFDSFEDFYNATKKHVKRISPVFNLFWDVKKDDLYWTRDLEGYYWICSVLVDKPLPYFDGDKDIGAILPVEAFRVGLEVPGQIKASFNRPRGGTAEIIKQNDSQQLIFEYSKYIFNKVSERKKYSYNAIQGNLLDNLPDFDLEELVISYLQIKEDYYVLSNSIANKSTTVKIECELISRSKKHKRRAVVQAKGGKKKTINALDYQPYIDGGYLVYLYAPHIENVPEDSRCIIVQREELMAFYNEYKNILPDSITKWEKLIEE